MPSNTIWEAAIKKRDKLNARIDAIDAKAEARKKPYRDELVLVERVIAMYGDTTAGSGSNPSDTSESPPSPEIVPTFLKAKGA